jgi:choline dehydrogenase-like flavoprotein
MSGRHVSYQAKGLLDFEADYVVVGSGAGGSAAAVVLARAGYQVALIEAGPWRDPEDYPHSMLGAFRDMFDGWGAQIAVGDSYMPVIQAQLVGGTTVINSAIVVRTPGDVLQQWRQDHGLGEVFTEATIGTAQDRIEHELKVGPSGGANFGRSSERMLTALQRLGMEGHPTLRNVEGCKGVNQCLQGCRNQSKRSTNLNWIPEVIERGSTVVSCAPVERIIIKDGVAVAIAGRFRHPDTRKRGGQFRVQARRGVLLAASATRSAPLMQRSGIRLPYLGHGWRAHPGSGIFGLYPDEVDMSQGPSQGAASVHHRLDVGIKLESLSLPLELVAGRLTGAGQRLVRRLEDFKRLAMWVTAVRAEACGTVRSGLFGGVSIHYQPTLRDLERLRSGAVTLARMHFEMGALTVRPGVHGLPFEIGPDELGLLENAPLNNRAWTWVLSHLFGGCVMGVDDKTSVVGPDLHVWGVRNLHVVDASALPTTLGVNPQHTIMAVAQVVAERLANEERSPARSPS